MHLNRVKIECSLWSSIIGAIWKGAGTMVTSVGWAVPTSPCQEHMRGMLLPAGAGHTCMHWQGQATHACTGRGRPHMHVLRSRLA